MGAFRENQKTGRSKDLSNSDLGDVHLRNKNLEGSDLTNAQLRGADLRCTNLMGADLRSANTSRGNFAGSNLENVIWKEKSKTTTTAPTSLRATELGKLILSAAESESLFFDLSEKNKSYAKQEEPLLRSTITCRSIQEEAIWKKAYAGS